MPCLEKTCLIDFSTISNTNLSVQLVAHWHANFSRLFYEFSRTSLVRIFKCRELVAKVPNMFNFFMRFFCLNMSQDCRANVANMPQRNFGEFTMRKFLDTRIIVVWMSYSSRATILRIHANISRLSGEKLKQGDMNVTRHAHECLATFVRMKMKLKLHSWEFVRPHEWLATVIRQSRDYRATVASYISKIRPKFANLSHKCPFNDAATWKLYNCWSLSRNSHDLVSSCRIPVI